jgi:hypothetical protein
LALLRQLRALANKFIQCCSPGKAYPLILCSAPDVRL